MEELLVRIGEMLDEKLAQTQEELRAEMRGSQENLRKEMQELHENLRKEMLDQYFLFEQEYGSRIIAIGDSVLLDNQKNVERAKKMHELEEKMDKHDVRIYACEQNIFKLQTQK